MQPVAGAPHDPGGVLVPHCERITVALGRVAPLIAGGLGTLFREHRLIDVVGRELDAVALASVILQRPSPSVVVIDEKMQSQLLEELVCRFDVGISEADRRSPDQMSGGGTAIVMLLHDPKPSFRSVLVAAGITCVDINAPLGHIQEAIRIAHDGGCLFVSADGSKVERRLSGLHFTSRELDVLELLSRKYCHATIAECLSITVPSARKATAKIMAKLDHVYSKRDLVDIPVKWFAVAAVLRAG